MSKITIITDSACDISQELARELGIVVMPLRTTFGDQEYLDGVTLTNCEFFEKLIEAEDMPHTSQNAPYQYEQEYKKVKDSGGEGICITLSSKLSGCWQSAKAALVEYSDCIMVVDSENVCIGQQILVFLAVRLRDEGKTATEIVEILEREKKNIRLLALLDTLEYLKRGGRISPAVAFAGSLLAIKPVISIEDGEVVLIGKARGSKNGNNLLVSFIEKSGGIDFTMPYTLGYSGFSDELLKKYIKDSEFLYSTEASDLPICLIGSTIGTHVGPGAIAVAFFCKQR